jgi:hypothetical protein
MSEMIRFAGVELAKLFGEMMYSLLEIGYGNDKLNDWSNSDKPMTPQMKEHVADLINMHLLEKQEEETILKDNKWVKLGDDWYHPMIKNVPLNRYDAYMAHLAGKIKENEEVKKHIKRDESETGAIDLGDFIVRWSKTSDNRILISLNNDEDKMIQSLEHVKNTK